MLLLEPEPRATLPATEGGAAAVAVLAAAEVESGTEAQSETEAEAEAAEKSGTEAEADADATESSAETGDSTAAADAEAEAEADTEADAKLLELFDAVSVTERVSISTFAVATTAGTAAFAVRTGESATTASLALEAVAAVRARLTPRRPGGGPVGRAPVVALAVSDAGGVATGLPWTLKMGTTAATDAVVPAE